MQERRWTTLADAERVHAMRDKPWVLRTENLEVRGTASLSQLVEVANRLADLVDRKETDRACQ